MKSTKMWRILTGVVALGMLAAPLAACGSSNQGASTDSITSRGKDDGQKISLWVRANLSSQAKHAASAYNASHKNKLEVTVIPSDDMDGKVGTAIQTDSLPDILASDVVRIPYYTQEGVFADLTKQINALPELSSLQKGHIAAGTYEGKKHTVPFVTDTSVMVWNKDLFKKAGLDPDKAPTSLEEFAEDAKKIAALNEDGVAGTYLIGQGGGGMTFTIYPSIWADGAAALSKDGTKSQLASAEAKKVLGVYRDLAKTKNGIGSGSKEETGPTWTAAFENGKIGIMPYPNTAVMNVINKEKSGGFKVGVAPIPGMTKGSKATYLGGDAMGITKSCKHMNQAWNFISWLMTDKAQRQVFAKYGDTASNFTTLKNAYKDADKRVQTMNSVISLPDSQTPIARNFSQAFNAAGSAGQLFFQDAIWGDSSKIASDNNAITQVLSGNQ